MELIKEFQERIGYRFKQEALLVQALTHSSYANERHMKKLSDNERLEFLGDAILELICSQKLFHLHPDWTEGQMTKQRASIVCEQTLAFCSRKIELGKYLLLGKGEDLTGGRKRKSVLSDAFEAVIGALYLDGGFANAKEFIHKYVMEDLDEMQLFYDSKTILQEYVQGHFTETLSYRLVREEGPDHDKVFFVEAQIGDQVISCGEGHTKKGAEQEAAYGAIRKLKALEEAENNK